MALTIKGTPNKVSELMASMDHVKGAQAQQAVKAAQAKEKETKQRGGANGSKAR
jgi:hypothetical protein